MAAGVTLQGVIRLVEARVTTLCCEQAADVRAVRQSYIEVQGRGDTAPTGLGKLLKCHSSPYMSHCACKNPV